jgi:hypothetical protein
LARAAARRSPAERSGHARACSPPTKPSSTPGCPLGGVLSKVLRLRPGWVIRDYDGVWGFRRGADTARFLAAFRAAGMPEG